MSKFLKKESKKIIIAIIAIMTLITVMPEAVLGATDPNDATPSIEITKTGNTARTNGKVAVGDTITLKVTDDKAVAKTVFYKWNYHFGVNTSSDTKTTDAVANPEVTIQVPKSGINNGYGLLELGIAVSDGNTASNYKYTSYYVMSNSNEINAGKYDTVGPVKDQGPESNTKLKIGEPITFSFKDNPIGDSTNSSTGVYRIVYKWVTEDVFKANSNDFSSNTKTQYGKDSITFTSSTPGFPQNIKNGDVYYLQIYAVDASGNLSVKNYWGRYTFQYDIDAPTINVPSNISKQYIELKNASSFVAPTITATDAYDNATITAVPNASDVAKIKNATEPGSYTIEYTATDNSGNVAKTTITVYVSDYTALQTAYNKANSLVLGDYTNDALWAELTTDIRVANDILSANPRKSEQSVIDTATDTLNNIMAELAKEENLTTFTKNLTEYENLVKTDYTSDSWNASKIEELLATANATSLKSVYDATLTSLAAAKASLVKADVSDITKKFDDIKDIIDELDESVYTPESWKTVQDAITAANTAKNTGLKSKYEPAVNAIDLSKLTLITMTLENKTVASTDTEYLNSGKEISFEIETNVKLEDTDINTITINGLTNIPLTKVNESGPNNGKYTYTFKVSVPSDKASLAKLTQGSISYTINIEKTVKVVSNGAVATNKLNSTVSGSDTKIIIDTIAPNISFVSTLDGERDTNGNITITKYAGETVSNTKADVEVIDTNKDTSDAGITITGTANMTTPGTYTITYTARDLAGNTKAITKTIEVKDYIASITLSNDNETTAYLSTGLVYGNAFDKSKVKVIVKTKTELDGNLNGEVKTLADIEDIITITNAPTATTPASETPVKVTVTGDKTNILEIEVKVNPADTNIPDGSKLPDAPKPGDEGYENYADYTATYGDLLDKFSYKDGVSADEKAKRLPKGWTFDALDGKTATEIEAIFVGSATKDGKSPAIYEFAVTYKGDANHKDVIGKVKIKVNKATPSYTLPTGLTATYGQKLSDVSFTDSKWSWKDTTESVGNVGTKTFKATYNLGDTANYNIVENIDVTVTVTAKAVTATLPNLESNYKDTPKTIGAAIASGITGIKIADLGTITYKVTNAVTGAEVTLSNTTPAGEYKITAVASNTNYNVTFVNATDNSKNYGTYKVNKINPTVADLNVSIPTGLTYDGTAKTATVTSNISEINDAITVKYNGSTDKPVNAGEYAVTVDIAKTDNYNAVTGISLGNDLSIGKLEIKPEHFQVSTPVVSVESDGEAKAFPLENITSTLLGDQINGKITIIYRDSSEKNKVTNPTKIGTYIVKIIVEDGENFTGTDGKEIDIGTSEVTLKIVEKALSSKSQVIVTATKVEATYAEDTSVTLDEETISVSVKESETLTKTLTKGTDYTITDITYRNEKDNTTTKLPENAAEYTAIITIKLENYSVNGSN
ncbi:MAG: MBG domain-containing protein, partial [Clostridia bacterium]|nr:MBG domain-containing protein [Clostridia bacterium]